MFVRAAFTGHEPESRSFSLTASEKITLKQKHSPDKQLQRAARSALAEPCWLTAARLVQLGRAGVTVSVRAE